MPNCRTVHIVNDNATVRRSLVNVLGGAGFVATTYRSAHAFLSAASDLLGGCALLDIKAPGMSGFEIQKHLHDMKIHLPVIIITARGDVETAVRAIRGGAADVLEKPYRQDVLGSKIETTLERSCQLDHDTKEAAAIIARLRPREHEVLQALTAGRSNKTIAFDLGISVRTVEVHRARMMERLGTRKLAEAVRLEVLARFA